MIIKRGLLFSYKLNLYHKRRPRGAEESSRGHPLLEITSTDRYPIFWSQLKDRYTTKADFRGIIRVKKNRFVKLGLGFIGIFLDSQKTNSACCHSYLYICCTV